MIGFKITDDTGKPVEGYNNLAKSAWNPPDEVRKLFARVQLDYQTAWSLQRRPFDEFDGLSLLERAKKDQETFAAFVGAEYVPQHKKWRWRGRKNTARNKVIGILAHMIAGMLYPYVHAKNDKDEEDKMVARVMRILVEDALRKTQYDMNFLFTCLSALVNPAAFVNVEYVEAMQRIKVKTQSGKYEVKQIVDDLLSGIKMHVLPIDEILLSDFYSGTGQLQTLPNVIRVRRISYDQAKAQYAGKYYYKGEDQFNFVLPGKTKVFLGQGEKEQLFDIDWTEADRNYVQELTAYYRTEDLEVTWVGGVFMGNYEDVYNSNPFKHRRFTKVKDEWLSVPLYSFAMGGFEPIDPAGRFAYYKSASFKEFWDDQSLNYMQRMLLDGTALDVFKPMFLSGMSKFDGTVIAPGATIGMPIGANATPFAIGSNLTAAYNAIAQAKDDLSESTQDKIMTGIVEKGVTAYATSKAEQNARIFLGIFGLMIAKMIKEVGELTMDCIISHTTVGELDASIPGALKRRFKTITTRSKEKGGEVTNRIEFTDDMTEMSEEEKIEKEWDLYEKAGGEKSDQRIYKTSPYHFARHIYTMYVDADKIVMKSMGADRQEKVLAFNMMSDPRVAPYTDQKAVVDDFVIDEFGGDDPDRYKKKGADTENMLNAMMGGVAGNQSAVMPPQSEEMPEITV